MKYSILLLLLCTLGTMPTLAQDPVQADFKPHWLALSVADLDAASAWYQEHLGFTLQDRIDLPDREIHIVFLRRDDFIIEMAQVPDSVDPIQATSATKGSQVRGIYKFGFMVDNIEAQVARMSEKGVDFQGDLFDDERFGVKTILVKDPEGNLIQLFEKL